MFNLQLSLPSSLQHCYSQSLTLTFWPQHNRDQPWPSDPNTIILSLSAISVSNMRLKIKVALFISCPQQSITGSDLDLLLFEQEIFIFPPFIIKVSMRLQFLVYIVLFILCLQHISNCLLPRWVLHHQGSGLKFPAHAHKQVNISPATLLQGDNIKVGTPPQIPPVLIQSKGTTLCGVIYFPIILKPSSLINTTCQWIELTFERFPSMPKIYLIKFLYSSSLIS